MDNLSHSSILIIFAVRCVIQFHLAAVVAVSRAVVSVALLRSVGPHVCHVFPSLPVDAHDVSRQPSDRAADQDPDEEDDPVHLSTSILAPQLGQYGGSP